MKTLRYLIVAAAILGAGSVATAFPFLNSWHMPSSGDQSMQNRAGAGGIYGTGSAQDWGLTCAHCHVKAVGKIDATITPTPAWQNIAGAMAYKPGQAYSLTVALIGEHLSGTAAMDNLNGMAMTFENSSGTPVGMLASDTPGNSAASCPTTAPTATPSGTTYVYGPAGIGCKTVVYVPKPNATSWTFSWTAPATGSGQVIGFYGVVDGDHDGKSSQDDDVKVGQLKLAEGN
jgi:hypothetical protein